MAKLVIPCIKKNYSPSIGVTIKCSTCQSLYHGMHKM